MECMTRCAAAAISFPILNITHMHKYSWQDFSGISAAWNAHFPILFGSDALICLAPLKTAKTFSLRALLGASARHFT